MVFDNSKKSNGIDSSTDPVTLLADLMMNVLNSNGVNEKSHPWRFQQGIGVKLSVLR